MAANDDKFVSNIALIESLKNCSILRHSRIAEDKDIEKKEAKWTELAQKFGLFGVLVGMHALLLSTQYQHMRKTVVTECSLTVTVASRQSMTDGVCRMSSVRIRFTHPPCDVIAY